MSTPKQSHFNLETTSLWDRVGDSMLRGLGMFLIFVAILTLIEISTFASMIEKILRLNSEFAFFLSVALIILEISGGIALFRRYHQLYVIIGMIITIGFLLFLSMLEIFQKNSFNNVSMGGLRILFSDMQIFFIQLVMVNILILFGITTQEKGSNKSIRSSFLFFIILGALNYQLIKSYIKFDIMFEENFHVVANFIDKNRLVDPSHRDFLVILLQHRDLNCPPCLESIIALTNVLRSAIHSKHYSRVIALMREEGAMFNQQRVEYWKKANDIPFMITLVPDSLYEQFNVKKSCAIVFKDRTQVLFHAEFPIRASKIDNIINLIKQ